MQDENPYQSPTEAGCLEATVAAESPAASSGRRLANLLLDQLACGLLAFGIAIIMVLIAVLFHVEDSVHRIPDIVVCVVVCFIYYVPQEVLFGKTLGKFVTGTKVVSTTGIRPTLGQIVGRTLCRMIPFEAFSFLFAGENPVGWHDRFSGTRVIRDR
jgi:uncharacterized RDD family membrane protein YckC